MHRNNLAAEPALVKSHMKRSSARAELLKRLAQAGREHSDATVLFHATIADRLGLNPSDEKAMSVLQRLGPLSAGEIAEYTGLATASVTNLVDRLEKKGFVRRVRDPKDRRRVIVEPASDRVAEAERLFRSTGQSLSRLYDGYSTDDLGVIADFLLRNAERLRTETTAL
jgi:DNA-binding MarR family transcriptional regulator